MINRKAFLYGNAQIKYQKTKITANFIEIDWNSNEIFAKSSVDSNEYILENLFLVKEMIVLKLMKSLITLKVKV